MVRETRQTRSVRRNQDRHRQSSTGSTLRSGILRTTWRLLREALDAHSRIDRGLDRLLEAYRGAGGPFITARDVHFYEVCIAAGWVCDAMASDDQAIATHSALRKVCCAESARCEDHSAAGWVSGYVSPGLSADEAS